MIDNLMNNFILIYYQYKNKEIIVSYRIKYLIVLFYYYFNDLFLLMGKIFLIFELVLININNFY